MNPLTQFKNTTILPLLISVAFACFLLAPKVRTVCQEGCLDGGNTVLGDDALLNPVGTISNTAVGAHALQNNGDDGWFNTAIGSNALANNTTGSSNTAVGLSALKYNTSGDNNTAIGEGALAENSDGFSNVAIGSGALALLTFGASNTAVGNNAMIRATTGFGNTVLGGGFFRLEEGNDNIAVGSDAGNLLTHGDNNIYIGNPGTGGENKNIRIGTKEIHKATFIAGISGATVPTGVAVIIDSKGHLGTTTSSARFKEAIKPMDNASAAILALKPVTFRYKHDLDPAGIPQFGLVAEDVEKVNPDLVARDERGKPYTVRYEAVNAMLLNEFLKEHRKVERLEKQVEALSAGLQKVSAELEANKSGSQTVLNDR